MRTYIAILLTALLLGAGCTTSRESKTPPAPGTVSPPTATGPAGTASPQEAPPELPASPGNGTDPLISPAPAGTLNRWHIKSGQPVDRNGLFFMNVATGDIDAWALGDKPQEIHEYTVSPDNRWIAVWDQTVSYLADRTTGAVYKLGRGAHLVEARGANLLLANVDQMWLAGMGSKQLTHIDVKPGPDLRAVFAPDGHAFILTSGKRVYLVSVADAALRAIGKLEVPGDSYELFLTTVRQGAEILVGTKSGSAPPARPVTLVSRYDWSGKLIAHRDARNWGDFSPDGTRTAWQDGLLGVDSALVVGGTADFSPQLRVRGHDPCVFPFTQGNPWLADGSGLVVKTTRGYRILRLDGTLAESPALQGLGMDDSPVPAPDRPGLFAVGGVKVVDGTGRTIAAATSAKGKYLLTGWLSPWGERSDEVRFSLGRYGKGYSCGPYVLPPEVDRAPFPVLTALEVRVPAGDCVNLRTEFSTDAPVIRCLPGGTRLEPSTPPGAMNKGERRDLGNPTGLGMGSQQWWHVRTPQGERGYVKLDAAYLDWARPSPQPPDMVANAIWDEAENMLYWLRVALGEAKCGALTCFNGPDLQEEVEGQLWWCQHSGPNFLRRQPGFAPARHEAGVKALESACSALLSARDSLGGYEDRAAWVKTVTGVKVDLDKAVNP